MTPEQMSRLRSLRGDSIMPSDLHEALDALERAQARITALQRLNEALSAELELLQERVAVEPETGSGEPGDG